MGFEFFKFFSFLWVLIQLLLTINTSLADENVSGQIESCTKAVFHYTKFELDISCFDLQEKLAFKVLSKATFWREQSVFLFCARDINSYGATKFCRTVVGMDSDQTGWSDYSTAC